MNYAKETESRKPNPILEASFPSKWFFWWTCETFQKGEDLQTHDLYTHLPNLDSQQLTTSLAKHWEKEVCRKHPNLWHMIFRAFGWKFIPISILYSALQISIRAVQPLFLGGLVSYFAETQNRTKKTYREACLYATGIVICSLLSTLCRHPFLFFLFEVGTRVRIACSGLVYRRCLGASASTDSTGQSALTIALLSSDLNKLDMAIRCWHNLWSGPVEACVFGYIMYAVLGWPALVGLSAVVVFIPVYAWAVRAAAHYRHKSVEFADQRVKLMNEIIAAIQVIKMYGWEKSFAKSIAFLRRQELRAVRGSLKIFAALQCSEIVSKVALFVSLLAYVVHKGDLLTAQKVFIVSSYYSLLNESLLHLWPSAVTTWAEMAVSARRVMLFLQQQERSVVDQQCRAVHHPLACRKGMTLRNVSASWQKATEVTTQRLNIQNVSFTMRQQQLLAIAGNVASGKSTLLHAILGELAVRHGTIEINGVISYAPQKCWLFGANVRDNIVFVEPYDEQRYRAVLHACVLERDLDALPYGDLTVVGEGGTSLSGGQKARIGVARCIYRRADIYVFDDPFCGVDAQVGKLLMDRCMLAFLNDKARILVTNRVHHLRRADHLVLLDDAKVVAQGSYDELRNMLYPPNAEVWERYNGLGFHQADAIMEQVYFPKKKRKKSKEQPRENEAVDRKELLLQGSVKWCTYLAYFKARGTSCVVLISLALFLLAKSCEGAMDIFISYWATWEETIANKSESESEKYCGKRVDMFYFYTAFVFTALILYIARTFGFFLMCLRISQRMHDRLFDGIIRARLSFFDNNPSGRILNRFSSDIDILDTDLPKTIMECILFFLNVSAVLIIVALANLWLLIPSFIIICLLCLCRRVFIAASRRLKRLEMTTRSPVYSHINQTFQGLTTIRAFSATCRMENEFHAHLNRNTSALYLYTSTNSAFAFWTDLICVLYILLVTFSFVLIDREFHSGHVGLAITQSLSLVTAVQWGLMQTAALESNMTSVERIVEYANTQPEPSWETTLPSLQLSVEWPLQGRLEIRNLCVSYSQNLYHSCAVNDLSLCIRAEEKIGIVGRTGAGKSSIIKAIFRLIPYEGSIAIDGYGIEKLGLRDLRSRISIIPQDPVLFTGTLRYNLDPCGEKSDAELWHALDDVRLKTYVSGLRDGLSYRFLEGGANFSMGQRQLVCLARAILRHNKILLMDEPTANVDPDTDKLIQQTIHTKFASCTILTIAHRLHTVMDNDRVAVIECGQLVEVGHPYELLQNRHGFLYKFVAHTGAVTAENLKWIAEQSYKNRVANKLPTN